MIRATIYGLLFLFSTLSSAQDDIVTYWNSAALDAIRAHGTPPPVAARNLAITHVAIYDAVNGLAGTHERYLVSGAGAPVGASIVAAASGAAHTVLSALYEGSSPAFDLLHATALGAVPDGPAKNAGIDWGETVAVRVLEARIDDGSAAAAAIAWPDSDLPGQWRRTESFGGNLLPAMTPGWGDVTPFALESGAQFRPPAPPALSTGLYGREFEEVRTTGAVDSIVRTVDQTETALFWGYGPGSATPPGHWNEIAQVVAADQGNTVADNARLFALLNIALADAAIVSWDAKYVYNYWRPITAIRLADTDGNAKTAADPAWSPLLPTPPFPEYTSGHSTFSGAAAVILALFYGRDRIPFMLGSDDLPGIYRAYGGFWEAAAESGMSRIYGGIHFMSANRHGLLTGSRTGRYVFHHYLRPVRDRRGGVN